MFNKWRFICLDLLLTPGRAEIPVGSPGGSLVQCKTQPTQIIPIKPPILHHSTPNGNVPWEEDQFELYYRICNFPSLSPSMLSFINIYWHARWCLIEREIIARFLGRMVDHEAFAHKAIISLDCIISLSTLPLCVWIGFGSFSLHTSPSVDVEFHNEPNYCRPVQSLHMN